MNKPTRKQFDKIRKLFYNKTKIREVNSLKWYRKPWVTAASRIAGLSKKDIKSRVVAVMIGRHKMIFVPGKLGSRPIDHLCTLTHENTHFEQQKKLGSINYWLRYAMKIRRMDIEADAYVSEIPVRNLFGKVRIASRTFTEKWGKIYNVSNRHVEHAKAKYEDKAAKIDELNYPSAELMLKCIRRVMK